MTELDELMILLTGSFNNKEQYSSLQKAERNSPYAEYISMTCSDKINNLPSNFLGKFIVEESIYEVNNKQHASSYLFLFTEKPEGILLTSYGTLEGDDKAGFSYKNMTMADFLCLKPSEGFTPTLSREKNGTWEGGSISMFTPVMRFWLLERFSEGCLKVSEAIEVNRERTLDYDQPILYKRVLE